MCQMEFLVQVLHALSLGKMKVECCDFFIQRKFPKNGILCEWHVLRQHIKPHSLAIHHSRNTGIHCP